MKRIILFPYKLGSCSARSLSEKLKESGVRSLRVNPDGRYTRRQGDVVVNWGSSTIPRWSTKDMLNDVIAVADASSKRVAMEKFEEQGVNTVVYTTSQDVATKWLSKGDSVVVRKLLRASGGRGIQLVHPGDELPLAPLYTKYTKKKFEYRVHIFNDEVILWQQKMNRKDYEGEVDYQIRNHSNGWVYAQDAATPPPECVIQESKKAIKALSLDFGAVDIGYNEHKQECYVYEVNTAPGLFGRTLEAYAKAITKVFANV